MAPHQAAASRDEAQLGRLAVVADETRAALVAAAVGEGTDATRERVTVAETEARDETPEQRFMRQHANRYLRFYNNRDGMVCLEGALDPDNGARLKAKVAAIASRMWRNDKQQAPSQRRSPQQRDIDALCAATSQPPRPDSTPRSPHADRPEHQGRRVVPVLRVSTSLESLHDGLHPPPASTTDNIDTADSAIAGATGVCSADPVSHDRDRQTIRAADDAAGVCSADPGAASGQQTRAVVAPDLGGRAANGAATERPKQLTLACYGRSEVTIGLPRTDDSSEITRTALRSDPVNSRRPPNRRRAASAQHTLDAQAIDTVGSSNSRPTAPAQHQQGRDSRENPLNTASLDSTAAAQHQQGRGSRENPLNQRHQVAQDTRPP